MAQFTLDWGGPWTQHQYDVAIVTGESACVPERYLGAAGLVQNPLLKGNLFYRKAGRQKEMHRGSSENRFVRVCSPRRDGWLIAREPGKLFDSGSLFPPAQSPSDLSSLGGCVGGLCSLRNVSACGRTQVPLLPPQWEMCSAYFKNVPCISCPWAAQCALALPLDIAWRKTLHPRRNFHPWPNAVSPFPQSLEMRLLPDFVLISQELATLGSLCWR